MTRPRLVRDAGGGGAALPRPAGCTALGNLPNTCGLVFSSVKWGWRFLPRALWRGNEAVPEGAQHSHVLHAGGFPPLSVQ